MMISLRLRRLHLLSFLFSALALYSWQTVVDADESAAGLQSRWDIAGPDGRTCLAEGDSNKICDDASSVIRLDYTINKDVKNAKYQIFQKNCEVKFDAGTSPIEGTVSLDNDNYAAISIPPPSNDNATVTASIEIRAQQEYLLSPWWRRMSGTEKEQQSIEFCIKMSLWLPPDAGDMMVNFRETNVIVSFERKEGVDSEEYVVNGVVLEPKPLKTVTVDFGVSSKREVISDDSGEQKKEEL